VTARVDGAIERPLLATAAWQLLAESGLIVEDPGPIRAALRSAV